MGDRIDQDGAPSGVASAPNAAYAFVIAFFEELARSGVRHVCVSPGSRSTPLAVSAAREAGLRCWSQLDERSAAFFALGLARATREPVALVCTSGTAAANYLPAIVEAHYSGVPLLVLTADRPPELREWGAGQTIDQLKLYGSHVRFFAELPLPEAGANALRYARSLACRAVAEARGIPAGPVHLNWPLRKPLDPTPAAMPDEAGWGAGDRLAERGRAKPEIRPYTEVGRPPPAPTAEQVAGLVDLVSAHPRGAIACGPLDAGPSLCAAVARFARLSGWPVLAEPTSQLRSGPHTEGAPILSTADLLLRDARFRERHGPEVVLRLGATPVSKSFETWIAEAPPEHLVLVDPAAAWNEPGHRASRILALEPELLFTQTADALEAEGFAARRSDWLEEFLGAEACAARTLAERIAAEEALLEPRAVRELCDCMPEGALLYVSSSMPVRDLDAFMPVSRRRLRVLCNRGANGIDGMVSSALGAAAAERGPTFLLAGDLAFLHDLGGLLVARRHPLRATIVVLDNDGGGIFSFLPIAEHGQLAHFEELFTTPHGLDLRHAAALYGLAFTRVGSWPEYRVALEKAAGHEGVSVIVVPVDRDANLAHFRSLVSAVGDGLLPSDTGGPT